MGHATQDRTASPATETARDVPNEAPGPDSSDTLALPHSSSIAAAGIATQDTQGQDAGDLGPEEDAGSAAPADPAGIAPGADEALGAATVAAAQAGSSAGRGT